MKKAGLIKTAEAEGYFIPEELEINEQVSSTVTTCFFSKILASKSDFCDECPLLQSIIKEAGHTYIFLPKFHFELNPIELLWEYINQGM